MRGPLAGVRVLDLGHDWACPHAARVLADFGAEVIKIEYPCRLDGMRGGVKENRMYDRRPRFHQLHRNKRSLTLDLKKPADLQAFKDLVRVSDVVIENSRAGVLDRLGAGYDVLKGLKPDLILVSMTAFGSSGPYASYAGYGGTLEALSGIQSLTAYDRDTAPNRVREMDVTNGILGACAVMTALVDRQQTGLGQRIDLSQLESATSGLIGEQIMEQAANGRTAEPVGNRHPEWAPHGCYRCDGPDRWVAIAVRSEGEWARLCEAMGRAEWVRDPRFKDAAARRLNHDELDRLIEDWTRGRSDTEAMHLLQEAGCAAGAVLDAAQLASDPHLEARGYFQQAADGSGLFPGVPIRLSGGGGVIAWRGPDLGRDNARILRDLLGRSSDDAEPLDEGSIGTAFEIE
jgi:crotonobetainyl-CoA:carnitine CoA-transferase CaiB-like acyl-CoA transferase